MKKQEKLAYLRDTNFALFAKTRQIVFDELSDQQTIFCCCGRLATGLHERNCTNFTNKVYTETIKRLSHLLQNGKEASK